MVLAQGLRGADLEPVFTHAKWVAMQTVEWTEKSRPDLARLLADVMRKGAGNRRVRAGRVDVRSLSSSRRGVATGLRTPSVDDSERILHDIRMDQTFQSVRELSSERLGAEGAIEVAHRLTHGQWTHDYAITLDHARNSG